MMKCYRKRREYAERVQSIKQLPEQEVGAPSEIDQPRFYDAIELPISQ
jgi:hypothetical protein